jgi:hypothetical protein
LVLLACFLVSISSLATVAIDRLAISIEKNTESVYKLHKRFYVGANEYVDDL